MLILSQHHYSESTVWDLCEVRPHNLIIDCNPELSTEPIGPHFKSLPMLSYVELSFQASSYDHNLFTRLYTLTYSSYNDLNVSIIERSSGKSSKKFQDIVELNPKMPNRKINNYLLLRINTHIDRE